MAHASSHRRPSLWRPGTLAGLVAAALSLGAGRDASAGPAEKFKASAAEVTTLDPARVGKPMEERIVAACFESLTVLDPATGQVKPGAAASWELAADGTTWTFKLQEKGVWRGPRGVVGPVKASDFVWTWRRLLDPDTRSPHAALLDPVAGAKVLAREASRKDRLYAIANDLGELMSGRSGIKGEDVVAFVQSSGVTRWAAGTTDPFLVKLLVWSEKDPMDPAKAKACRKALEDLAKDANTAYEEAKAHVGVDRGFFAKDDRTLVIQTAGPAPYLPQLVAHAALAPLHPDNLRANRDAAFQDYNFTCNGAYVSKSPAPKSMEAIEPVPFKVVLERNPDYWNAAAVSTPRIDLWVDRSDPDMLELYANGDLHWLASLHAPTWDVVRAAKAPDWKKPSKMDERTAGWYRAVAKDYQEQPARAVYALRFRCDMAPCDRKEIRQALASLVDRETCLKAVVGPRPRPLVRFVLAGTPAAAATVPLPTLDASKAKTFWGNVELPDGLKFLFRDEEATAHVKTRIENAWDKGLGIGVNSRGGYATTYLDEVEKGDYHALLGPYVPAYDDPLGYLAGFESGNPAGATGWSNATYDALVRGAYDPAGFAKAPDDAWKTLKEAAAVKSLATAAASGKPTDLEALRQRLLLEAEALLLEECVVVPLWQPMEASAVRPGVKGFAADPSKARFADAKPLTGVTFEG